MYLYIDVLFIVGFGGFFNGYWFCDSWLEKLLKELDREIFMVLCEFYFIVVVVIFWGKYWFLKRIFFYCDNVVIVNII